MAGESSRIPDEEMREVDLGDPRIRLTETQPSKPLYIGIAVVIGVLLFIFIVCALVAGFSQENAPPRANNGVEVWPLTARTLIAFDPLFVGLVGGLVGLLVVVLLTYRVLGSPVGVAEDCGPRMLQISSDIAAGARAFLLAEYKVLAPFVLVIALLLVLITFLPASAGGGASNGWRSAVCFLVGASTSALCGWVGMAIATASNVRTTNAARHGLSAALSVAFRGGTVMGLMVVGLGLVAVSFMLIVFGDITAIAALGFGASMIALFARVGGGIFTKAADVGADLVGKVEEDIPEDDPRNPGVIADNVGDNVGDVAGMGADLFESYVGSIIAAVSLATEMAEANPVGDDGAYTFRRDFRMKAVALPFYLAAAGVMCSIVGAFAVRTTNTHDGAGSLMSKLLMAIRKGVLVASVLNVGCALVIIGAQSVGDSAFMWLFVPFLLGLAAGVGIGFCTEYYTSFEYSPTQDISRSGITGPATVIIRGLATGMISVVPPVAIISVAILGSYAAGSRLVGTGGGEYALAIAAVGMLSTLGVTLATDAFGPIADNAGGIAEMAHLPHEVREVTDALDSLGNTTAATGKGFAIGSAVLTAIALLRAFKNTALPRVAWDVKCDAADILDQFVLVGVLVGVCLPFVFAAQTMVAVGHSAQAVIEEVRRQFREIEGLRAGTAVADHTRCVSIATKDALRKMILPGLMAVCVPIVFGFLGGPRMLLGVLGGAILAGFVLAVSMANSGGAWDNAKKWVEAGHLKNAANETCGKGSEPHKATVVGDTVGDPFKDTSGPALNILIKLMCILSLVLAPLIRQWGLLDRFTRPQCAAGAPPPVPVAAM